jgi:ribose transport system substrate-binding protein
MDQDESSRFELPGTTRSLRHRSGRWTLAALLSCSLVLAACGSDDGGSEGAASDSSASDGGRTANVDEAKTRLEAAMGEPAWESPGPAFDAAKAKGKKVMYIGVAASIPIVKTIYDAMKDAGSQAGIEVTQFDGKGQVSEFNRGIETAIAQKYDAITLLAIPSDLVSGAIADAKKAGIPVIQVQEHDPGSPLADGVVGQVTFCYSCAGKLIADFVIADSGGDAKGTIFISKDVSNGTDEEKGMRDEFAELCPDCEFESQNVPVAEWNSKLSTLTRSTLTSKPDTNYLLALYDGMTIPMIPAVAQAGKADSVKIVSFNATPAVMQEMAKGNVVAADVGGANVWFGWGLADQVLRVLSGEDAVEDENIPLRMFTPENMDSIDLSKDESTWYGSADFEGEYKKLWGLGG